MATRGGGCGARRRLRALPQRLRAAHRGGRHGHGGRRRRRGAAGRRAPGRPGLPELLLLQCAPQPAPPAAAAIQGGLALRGGIGDGRRGPAAPGDGLVGLPGIDHPRHRSFSNIFQEESNQRDIDRQSGRNDFLDSSGMQYALHRKTAAMSGLQRDSNEQALAEMRNNDLSSHGYASILGPSLSRSASPDPELVRRVPSPCLPPIGVKVNAYDKKSNGGSSSFRRSASAVGEPADDLVAALSGMNLSSSRAGNGQTMDQSKLYQDVDNANRFLFYQTNGNQQHSFMKRPDQGHFRASEGYSANSANSSMVRNQMNAGNLTSPDNSSAGSGFGSPRVGSRSPGGTLSSRQNLAGAYKYNYRGYNGMGSPNAATSVQMPIDPLYVQYLPAQVAASYDDPFMASGILGNSYMDLLGPQSLSPLLQSQKNYGCYGNLGYGLGYAGSPLTCPVLHLVVHLGMVNAACALHQA